MYCADLILAYIGSVNAQIELRHGELNYSLEDTKIKGLKLKLPDEGNKQTQRVSNKPHSLPVNGSSYEHFVGRTFEALFDVQWKIVCDYVVRYV
jgi:hypothetical protein